MSSRINSHKEGNRLKRETEGIVLIVYNEYSINCIRIKLTIVRSWSELKGDM